MDFGFCLPVPGDFCVLLPLSGKKCTRGDSQLVLLAQNLAENLRIFMQLAGIKFVELQDMTRVVLTESQIEKE